MMKKVQITERALLARVNRKLAHEHKKIRKCREGTRAHSSLGGYYVLDTYKNIVIDDRKDLVAIAKDAGILKEFEEVV